MCELELTRSAHDLAADLATVEQAPNVVDPVEEQRAAGQLRRRIDAMLEKPRASAARLVVFPESAGPSYTMRTTSTFLFFRRSPPFLADPREPAASSNQCLGVVVHR